MKPYFIILFVLVFVNVFLMLLSIDSYVKSLVSGVKDITLVVFGSLFLILLLFVYAFMFSKVVKYPSFDSSSKTIGLKRFMQKIKRVLSTKIKV